jgi:hypothetical protein
LVKNYCCQGHYIAIQALSSTAVVSEVRASVCPRLSQGGLMWNLIFWAFIKIHSRTPNWLKSSGNIEHSTWRHKHILLFLVTLNWHTSAPVEWNGIRLLGWLSRYKHYANAPQYYVTRTLPIFFIQWYTLPYVILGYWLIKKYHA